MTKDQRDYLMAKCELFINRSDLKPATKKAKELAYAYWVGVLNQCEMDGKPADAYVTICLMSGRIEDLMFAPDGYNPLRERPATTTEAPLDVDALGV